MMLRAVFIVAARVWYSVIGGVTAACIAAVTLLWPNAKLLWQLWLSDAATTGQVISLASQLLWGASMSMGAAAVSLIVVTACLFGIVVSLMLYVWWEKRLVGSWRELTMLTGGGAIAAVLGIGCAVCGPLLLASLLALFGGAGVLLLLPWHGVEVMFVAIGLLLFAWYMLSRIITAPDTCIV